MRGHWSWTTLWVSLVASFGVLALMSSSAFAVEANGSFVKVTGAGSIYEVIGGAAIHVDSCSTLNGCPDVEAIPSLAGYASVPADGTFIQIKNGVGYIGEIVGGAIIHVDSCAILKCTGTLPLDPGGAADYMAAHRTPAGGTFVDSVGPGNAGWIGEVLGAAIIHVDSCSALDSCAGKVRLDAGGLGDYMEAHKLPVDGTFIRAADGPSAGSIAEVIGGALIHVGSCTPLAGCAGDENLDSGAIADYVNANPLPANGTFVKVAGGPQSGLIARVAGGAFLTIGDCAAIGGCPSVIDQLDSGGFDSWSSAHSEPVDGTYLLGLPSNATWEVLGGQRQPAAATTAAVPVDDASLNTIPVVVPPAASPTPPSEPVVTVTPSQPTTTSPKVKRAVRLTLKVRWRPVQHSAQRISVYAASLKRPDRLTITCTGTRCPYRTKEWERGTAKSFLGKLNGFIYRTGDRVTLTISRPGYTSERIRLTVRDDRAPLARLL